MYTQKTMRPNSLPSWFQKIRKMVEKDGLRKVAPKLGIHWTTLHCYLNGSRNPRPITLDGLKSRLEAL